MGLLLCASRHRQVNRLALRPRGSGSTVQRRLQRCRERGRVWRDGQPRRSRRRGRFPHGRSIAEESEARISELMRKQFFFHKRIAKDSRARYIYLKRTWLYTVGYSTQASNPLSLIPSSVTNPARLGLPAAQWDRHSPLAIIDENYEWKMIMRMIYLKIVHKRWFILPWNRFHQHRSTSINVQLITLRKIKGINQD